MATEAAQKRSRILQHMQSKRIRQNFQAPEVRAPPRPAFELRQMLGCASGSLKYLCRACVTATRHAPCGLQALITGAYVQCTHGHELLKDIMQEVRVDMEVVRANGDSSAERSNSGHGKDPESQARPVPACVCHPVSACCACSACVCRE